MKFFGFSRALARFVLAIPLVLAVPASASARWFDRIVIVVLENTLYHNAIRQPFIASLIGRGALLTNYRAPGHPSEPNYLELISGSTQGVTDDRNVTIDKRHIGDLLEAKGLSWKAYAEGYPATPGCHLAATYPRGYARKHVPFLSFRNIQTDAARCAKVVPGAAFAADVNAGHLPAYSLFIPNLNNDGHDTGVAYADKWLGATMAPLLDDDAFMKGTLFVVTFDENEGGDADVDGNRVATVLVGPAVRPGVTSDVPARHASLLRLVEDNFDLGDLGLEDKAAAPIADIWR